MDKVERVLMNDANGLIPLIAISVITLEYLASRLLGHDIHDRRETACSIVVAIGNKLARLLEVLLISVPFFWVYQHRLFAIDHSSTLMLVLLFLGVDFCYYWHHRICHNVRWFWTGHAVHHSVTKLNLTAGVRVGWTMSLTGEYIFYLPLIWIGFHPTAVLACIALNIGFQFLVHTEVVPKLWGPIEYVFNTPANHRVHHAMNKSCIDRNFAGVFIIFDRMFGTYTEAPKDETLRYGLTSGPAPLNPFKLVFQEWVRMWQDAWHAPDWRGRAKAIFGPPN